AQTINVLQALFLVEGDQVVTTPTGHVYEMYAGHHGAESLRTRVEAADVEFTASGKRHTLSGLIGSASRRGDALLVTFVNPRLGTPLAVEIDLRDGAEAREGSATVLTHTDCHAHNTFDAPETLVPRQESVATAGRRFT